MTMETQLYHIHPVFEFYLTAYFGILIAPKFLQDYFEIYVPQRILDQDKENLKLTVSKIEKSANENIASFRRRLQDLQISEEAKKDISEGIADCESMVKNQCKTLYTNAIKDPVEIRKQVVPHIRDRFENLLTLMLFYNFIILATYGCELSFHEPFRFMVTLINFNFFLLLFILFFFLRQRLIDKFRGPNVETEENILSKSLRNFYEGIEDFEYNFIFTILILIVIGMLTFVWDGYFDITIRKDIFINYSLLLTIIIGSLPVVWFGLSLRWHSRRLYTFEFNREKGTTVRNINVAFMGLRTTFEEVTKGSREKKSS